MKRNVVSPAKNQDFRKLKQAKLVKLSRTQHVRFDTNPMSLTTVAGNHQRRDAGKQSVLRRKRGDLNLVCRIFVSIWAG